MEAQNAGQEDPRTTGAHPRDARELEQAIGHNPEDTRVHRANPEARHSEFPVSRGGLNQESDHNKHNDPGQSGHKPPKPTTAQQKH